MTLQLHFSNTLHPSLNFSDLVSPSQLVPHLVFDLRLHNKRHDSGERHINASTSDGEGGHGGHGGNGVHGGYGGKGVQDLACKMNLQRRLMKMESISHHCAHQHALESILDVSMNRRRSKSILLASTSYFPPSGITKDITMIIPAWSLSLLNYLLGQVFHLIV